MIMGTRDRYHCIAGLKLVLPQASRKALLFVTENHVTPQPRHSPSPPYHHSYEQSRTSIGASGLCALHLKKGSLKSNVQTQLPQRLIQQLSTPYLLLRKKFASVDRPFHLSPRPTSDTKPQSILNNTLLVKITFFY